ncbi:MAG: hypothetical protein J3Q66DRAFT_393508 [Benniella sp.]|nr:MAG: hypothetical protein J3Q66DRAFT_393508 [Benniella sp.]
MEGVKRVWQVENYQLPTPQPPNGDLVQPNLALAHQMTGVDYVQETFKYTGKEIKVAVIDTGIDYTHPALGVCSAVGKGEGCIIVAGYDFIGDNYNVTSKPVEDADPIDNCHGHGTHVALNLKPDISGPGGNVLSTYPQKLGSYKTLSGTSMSAPYIAGAHALLLNILMNTAIPGHFPNTKAAPGAKQGGGLVNVKNAITTTTLFTPDRIELRDSTHFTGQSVNVTLRNLGDTETIYFLSHEPAETAVSYRGRNTFPFPTPLLEDNDAMVKFSSIQTVPITIEFQEPSTGQASDFPFYSGYNVATPQDKDAIPARIPYAGMKGDIAMVPMLDTGSSYPTFVIFNRKTNQTDLIEPGHKINWGIEQPISTLAWEAIHLISSFLLEKNTVVDLPIVSLVRCYQLRTSTGVFAGFLNTLNGRPIYKVGRTRNFDEDGKRAYWSTGCRDGKVFLNRTTTTPTTPPAGDYNVMVVAQHKLAGNKYPEDFEIHEVATIESRLPWALRTT